MKIINLNEFKYLLRIVKYFNNGELNSESEIRDNSLKELNRKKERERAHDDYSRHTGRMLFDPTGCSKEMFPGISMSIESVSNTSRIELGSSSPMTTPLAWRLESTNLKLACRGFSKKGLPI